MNTTGIPLRGFAEADPAGIVDDLGASVVWLKEIGLRVAGTRLETYTRHLDAWLDAAQGGDQQLTHFWRRVGADEVANAIFEASEWHAIYIALGDKQPNSEPKAQLRKYVDGRIHCRDEGTNTTARDIQFELSFGARLLSAGLAVKFGGGGDIAFPFRGKQMFVECKRVQKTSKIATRVRQAHGQLTQRYNAAADPRICRGFVALSVTKALNPTQMRGFQVPTWPDLRAKLRELADRFAIQHQHAWRQLPGRRLLDLADPFAVRSKAAEVELGQVVVLPSLVHAAGEAVISLSTSAERCLPQTACTSRTPKGHRRTQPRRN
jgi:hypothetical protein